MTILCLLNKIVVGYII